MRSFSGFTLLAAIFAISLCSTVSGPGPTQTAPGLFSRGPTAAAAPGFPTPGLPVSPETGDPVLFFSDLTSGPKSGNSDTSDGRSGQDGAIVTVWGRNLGSSQGASLVYIGGTEAASTYAWGNANQPANLYASHAMQMVSFQISRQTRDGPASIWLEVNGRPSNSLPFTVRAGAIRFVSVPGNDDSGDGSWGNPWHTIQKAASSLNNGDIAYILDGVNQTNGSDLDAAVNLGSDGAPDHPKALVVYPGAVSQVGNPNIQRAFWVWNVDMNGYSHDWVLSKFSITTAQTGIFAQTGFRVVGNHITAPKGDGAEGSIGATGSNVFILGNELENVGSPNSGKLYHTIYLTGVRKDTAPRAPTESNREVGWNYLHDNLANRAINVYSEQDQSAFIEGHRIHDNAILRQRGDGILLGYYVTGDNWIYNNLVVNAGQGPEWPDDPSYHTGIRLSSGHELGSQTRIYVYNNTLYGNGWAGASYPGETGSLLIDPGALQRATVIDFGNNLVYSTGEPYLAGESASLPDANYRNCWYGSGASPAWDGGAIVGDPLFVNPSGLDFQLQAGSPCIDTGRDTSSVAGRDLLGSVRPQGSGFDLGVYEKVSEAAAPALLVYLPLVRN